MSMTYNGSNVYSLDFNGNDVQHLYYNGTEVQLAAPAGNLCVARATNGKNRNLSAANPLAQSDFETSVSVTVPSGATIVDIFALQFNVGASNYGGITWGVVGGVNTDRQAVVTQTTTQEGTVVTAASDMPSSANTFLGSTGYNIACKVVLEVIYRI